MFYRENRIKAELDWHHRRHTENPASVAFVISELDTIFNTVIKQANKDSFKITKDQKGYNLVYGFT